jgi:hypothetical protein
MKKLALLSLALLVLAVPMTGCYGPQMVNRGFSDWLNEGYTGTPWLYGNVISYGIISLVNGITWFVDGFVNAYYFWAKDAQPFGDGVGTTYTHKVVTPKKK